MDNIHMRFNRYIFVSLLPYRCVLFINSYHKILVCSVRTPYLWWKSVFIQSCITSQPVQLLKNILGNYGQEVVCLVEFIFSSLLSTSFFTIFAPHFATWSWSCRPALIQFNIRTYLWIAVELSEEECNVMIFVPFGRSDHDQNHQYLGKQTCEVRGHLEYYPAWQNISLCKFAACTYFVWVKC